MSEFINNQTEARIEGLMQFSMGIMAGENGKELIEKYRKAIENVTPHDILEMEDRQVKKGVKPALIKEHIEKIMNGLSIYLDKYEWEKPEKGHPLYYLMKENRMLEDKLADTKNIFKRIVLNNDEKIDKNEEIGKLIQSINGLKEFNIHYIKKENILFPYLENKWDNYRPLQVMWSLHDDIRQCWKDLINLLTNKDELDQELQRKFARLCLLMYRMIFKEEKIIFPVAMDTLNAREWKEIQEQSQELGYFHITPQEKLKIAEENEAENNANYQFLSEEKIMLKTKTGSLDLEQIIMIFNNLPVDITFVDEKNIVRYFNNPEQRFFPRSPAIIGRKVQNCHPPESVHIVNKILDSFKKAERDKARFWIQMQGKFLLIEYFALRDKNGEYKGTLEISQDITEIKDLEDERRLIEWG